VTEDQRLLVFDSTTGALLKDIPIR
jgi:hypothetical protein